MQSDEMVVELTQQDLKKAKESLKALSRENCRHYLDGIYQNRKVDLFFP